MGLLLLLQACGVEKTIYQPILSTDSSEKENSLSNLDFGQSDSSEDDSNPELQNQNLESLLDQFYNSFIHINDSGNFSSSILFESLYNFKKNRDAKFNQLESAILEKIESPNALKGRGPQSKIAFYLNAYNFHLIRLIYLNYMKNGQAIKSLSELNPSRGRKDIFSAKVFYVAGRKELSLNEIAQGATDSVLALSGRKDPRLLFALNCATLSCPIILNQAFQEEKLNAQLDFVASNSLKSKNILRFEAATNTFYLSYLFKDFADVFDANPSHTGMKAFIKHYTSISITNSAQINYNNFDWTLNRATTNEPITLDTTIISTTDNPAEVPCSEYTADKAFSPRAICRLVLQGEDSSYKYTVERGNICILRNEKASTKKDIAMRIVGNIEEVHSGDKVNRSLIDLKIKSRDIKIGHKLDNNGLKNTITEFSHKAREVTSGKTTLTTHNDAFKSFQLNIKQRFRFFSLDLFQWKNQRNFTLGCDLIPVDMP